MSLSREWQFRTENQEMLIPIITDNLLIASSRTLDGDVFGLDPDDSTTHWESHYDSPLATEPIMISDTIFAAHTGIRRSPPIHRVQGGLSPPEYEVKSPSVLRSYRDEIVIGHISPHDNVVEIVGISPGTSSPNWTYRPSIEEGAVTDIAIHEDNLYVSGRISTGDTGTGGGVVSAYDIATGTEKWRTPEEGRIQSIAVSDTAVYAFPGSPALDRESGDELWRADTNAPGGGISYPAVGSGTVYVGRGTSIAAVDSETGEIQWETELNATALRPSIGGTAIDVVANSLTDRPARFAAIDALTGDTLFEETFGDAVLSAPAIANEAVFFGVDDGRILKYS
jgi:outer membrane protein assembly factor BamB